MFITFRFNKYILFFALGLLILVFTVTTVHDESSAVSSYDASRSRVVLIIDPGHGGEDGGAQTADGMTESEINYDIAVRLRAVVGFLGVHCVMTRDTENISYPDNLSTTAARKVWDQHSRLELINSVSGATLISIHQNSYPDPRPKGPQVLFNEDGAAFATALHSELTEQLSPDSRRVAVPAQRNIFLMKNAECPAVLIECGFLSNPAEVASLLQPEYRTKIAVIIAATYQSYTSEETHSEDKNDLFLH